MPLPLPLLSFSLAFPPLANIIPFFHPFSLPLQNGSRQSGRSSNTPACGSRRVCPSAASTLADDSSSRSFERRPASLFLPFSFSFSLSHFLSLFSPLSFSLFLSLHSSLFCFLAFISNDRRFVSSSNAARSTFQVDTARTRQTDALYRRRGIVIRRAVYVLSQSQTSQRDGTLADQRIATTHRLIGG